MLLTAGCIDTTTVQNNPFKGDLKINGSSTLYPSVQKSAEAFMTLHPESKITVVESSSGAGISELIAGRTDLAPSSRAPKASEFTGAVNGGKSLHMTVVDYDAVVVVVNPANPLSDLTVDQLNQVFFSGTVNDWSQLTNGAKTGKIHVYVADPKSSGTAEFFSGAVGKGAPFIKSAIVIPMSGDLAKQVISDPNGIAFTSMEYITPDIRTLTVNSVKPSIDTALDTTYPLSRKVYMITDGAPSGLEKEFINFMLSQQGQKIAEDRGLIPII